MATATLPIHELEVAERKAEKAQTETRCVVLYSSGSDDISAQFRILRHILVVKMLLSGLASIQSRVIRSLQSQDFEKMPDDDLKQLAASLEKMASRNRDLLALTADLGSQIRVWWRHSIRKITEQSDHLESIAESLRVAADPDSTAMLALAAEECLERAETGSGDRASWRDAVLR